MSKSVYSLLIGIVAGFLLQSTSLANADENLFHKLIHKIEHRKNVIEFDETDIYLEQKISPMATPRSYCWQRPRSSGSGSCGFFRLKARKRIFSDFY